MSTFSLPRTMDLADLAVELRRRQDSKFDFVADTRTMGFYTDAQTKVSCLYADNVEAPTPDGFPVNSHTHAQVADRIGIPKKYYDRMRNEAPVLLDTNVGHWFIEKPDRRLVRTLDGHVRAFLSDRYRRLDDYDLMERAVLPVFSETQGLTVHLAALTPERMHVRAYLPGMQQAITSKVGDIVCAGVSIRNSEVGAGALAVEPWLMKLACLNGMTIPAYAMRKYHIGKKIEEEDDGADVFSDETLAADDTAFFLKVRDLVRAALDEVKFADIVQRLRETADPLTTVKKPVKAVEVLTQKHGLTEDEGESILTHLIQGGDLSQWGVLNAVTRAAQDTIEYERQVEMEALGGVLAALPATEWKEYARA